MGLTPAGSGQGVLKLDTRLPLVWRSPTELQVGVDEPVARLEGVSRSQERLLTALSRGISRRGLSLIGLAAEATEDEVETLLSALGDAVHAGESAPGITGESILEAGRLVVVDGTGDTADTLAAVLTASGHRVAEPGDEGADRCSLAVIVADYVIAPQRYTYWLNRDIPHLPIVFSDRWVSIGPLVEPGNGPCLYCLERTRTDSDAAWPAIAGQLLGRTSEHNRVDDVDAAVRAARIIQHRLVDGSHRYRNARVLLDPRSGRFSVRACDPHPECGCRVLPENVTALAGRRAADRSGRMTATALSSRG